MDGRRDRGRWRINEGSVRKGMRGRVGREKMHGYFICERRFAMVMLYSFKQCILFFLGQSGSDRMLV